MLKSTGQLFPPLVLLETGTVRVLLGQKVPMPQPPRVADEVAIKQHRLYPSPQSR